MTFATSNYAAPASHATVCGFALSLSRSQHNQGFRYDEGKLGKTSQCELHSAAPKKILPPPLCTWIFCSPALHSKLKLQFDKHRDICATGSCTGLVWLQAEEKPPPPASILWIFVKMGKRNQTICTFEPTSTKLSGCVADRNRRGIFQHGAPACKPSAIPPPPRSLSSSTARKRSTLSTSQLQLRWKINIPPAHC